MGSEECERSGAGKHSFILAKGGTLNAFRFCKATMEVYCRSPGAHKMVICCSLLEKIIETFAGIPKLAILTASSQLLPIGRSKQDGTLIILVLLLRRLSTAKLQFNQFKAPNLRQTVSRAATHRLWMTMTSLTKHNLSPRARALISKKHPNGYRDPAVRHSALAGRLSVSKEAGRRHRKDRWFASQHLQSTMVLRHRPRYSKQR